MRLIVTGASGFIGPILISVLSQAGHEGVAVSRSGLHAVSANWVSKRREEMLPFRMCDSMAADLAPALIHLEVKQHVAQPSVSDIAEFTSINVDGTQQWLEWCTMSGVRNFIFFSSIKAVRPESSGLTTESAEGPHQSPYGASKWEAEQRVRAWVKANASRSALILRPSVVYGGRNFGNVGAMVTAIRRNRFFLVGRNENVKSLASVKNVAAAVAYLIDKMEPGRCETYNVVDRESFSVRHVDHIIRAQLGKSGNSPTLPVSVARVAAMFGDVLHLLSGSRFPINSQRLNALLESTHFSCQKLLDTGFVHQQSTEEGIAEMVDWYIRYG